MHHHAVIYLSNQTGTPRSAASSQQGATPNTCRLSPRLKVSPRISCSLNKFVFYIFLMQWSTTAFPMSMDIPFAPDTCNYAYPKNKKNFFSGLITSFIMQYMEIATIHFIGQVKSYTGNRNVTPLILKVDTRWSCQRIRTGKKPFEMILLQTTRKENNWKTEETLERAVVSLETERIKGPNP